MGGASARRLAREHGADPRHVALPEQPRRHRVRELAAVTRLLPVVTERMGAGELGRRDLGLAGPVGTHQADVLASAQ